METGPTHTGYIIIGIIIGVGWMLSMFAAYQWGRSYVPDPIVQSKKNDNEIIDEVIRRSIK